MTTMASVKLRKEFQGDWVAEIKGLHPQYKFEREFVEADNNVWVLEEGKIYDVNIVDRYFAIIENGKLIKISESKVFQIFAPTIIQKLPKLEGSEAQIKWAERIRAVYFNNIDDILIIAEKVKDNIREEIRESTYEHFLNNVEEQKAEISAKVWIDKFQDLTQENSVSELHTLARLMRSRVTREVIEYLNNN